MRPKPASSWRKISKRMRHESPVFIVGCNRSGTTALRRTLERLPAFETHPGPEQRTRSPETRIFARPRRVFYPGSRKKGRRPWNYLLRNDAEARGLLDTLGASSRWRKRHAPHWLRIYFHFAQRARGVERLLEKTPSHVRHLKRLYATFPRARVIASIRHPVDVYASVVKRRTATASGLRRRRRGRWQDFSEEDMARTWNEVARIVSARCRTDAARFYLVRYEDLTTDPGAVLRDLCAFIGEPFDAARLLGNAEGARERDGSPFPDTPIVSNRKRWSDFIDEAAARRIEELTAEGLEDFGYERYT